MDLIIYLAFALSLAGLTYASSFRKKFLYFVILLITSWVFGTTYGADGLVLMLVLTECCVLLIFLLAYLTIQFKTTTVYSFKAYFIVFFIVSTTLYVLTPLNLALKIYSSLTVYTLLFDQISSDFFILFYTLYYINIINIYLLSLLLGLFSIFFIYVYFLLKKLSLLKSKNCNKVYILRKQHLTHQARYKTMLYNFQK